MPRVCSQSPFLFRHLLTVPETNLHSISTQRKGRGIVLASITRLGSRVKELESTVEEPTTHDLAQHLATKLEMLDAEFKTNHFSLIDLIDNKTTLATEQETPEQHDDDVTALAVHIQQVLTMSSATPTHIDQRMVLARKLQHLEKNLSPVSETIGSLTSHSKDNCHLQQHEEKLSDYKKDLADFRNGLLSLDLTEGDELLELHATLEKHFFDCSLQIKELLQPYAPTHEPTSAPTPSDSKGVKLPKLDVPTFDGNILNWKCFW